MSDWFSLMAYLEASEANDRISALESCDTLRKEEMCYDVGKSLGEELVNLLQELYKNNNNIANIDLSNISSHNRTIHNHFVGNNMTIRPIKNERQEKINIALLLIAFITVMYFINVLWLKTIIGIIIGLNVLSNWDDIKNNRQKIKEYDENKEQHLTQHEEKLYPLKARFPNLTARGVFFKYIIDEKCKDVIALLQKNPEYGDPLNSLQVLYGLFDLKADTSFEYPVDTIKAMNTDLATMYDSIASRDIDGVPIGAGIKADALKRASTIYPGSKFKQFDDLWKKDRDVVLAAVKNHPAALEFADDEFKKDKEVVLATLSNAGFSGGLRYANESLKKDKEIVKAFIERSAFNIDDADLSLKKDKAFVMQLFTDNNCNNGHALKYVDDSLRNDKEVVLSAVNITGDALEYASDDLKSDKEVVLSALASHGDSYKFVDESLKNDPDILLKSEQQSTSEELIEQYTFESWCDKQEKMSSLIA